MILTLNREPWRFSRCWDNKLKKTLLIGLSLSLPQRWLETVQINDERNLIIIKLFNNKGNNLKISFFLNVACTLIYRLLSYPLKSLFAFSFSLPNIYILVIYWISCSGGRVSVTFPNWGYNPVFLPVFFITHICYKYLFSVQKMYIVFLI